MRVAFVIAAASLGLVWASGTASATPLAAKSPAPMGYEHFDGAIEPVHYRRRAVRRYYGGPVISFGPIVAPYHTYPYRRAYSPYHYPSYGYGYPSYGYPAYGYGYPYSYGPSFSFGIRIR